MGGVEGNRRKVALHGRGHHALAAVSAVYPALCPKLSICHPTDGNAAGPNVELMKRWPHVI